MFRSKQVECASEEYEKCSVNPEHMNVMHVPVTCFHRVNAVAVAGVVVAADAIFSDSNKCYFSRVWLRDIW